MSITVLRCANCNKIAEQASLTSLGSMTIVTYRCGHSSIVSSITTAERKKVALDGSKELYPFQDRDINTIESANARVLLTYECGLGKTITSLFTLYNHPEMFPCLIICKSKLLIQWLKQVLSITGQTPLLILNGKQVPIPGIKFHIISFDLVKKFNKKYKNPSDVRAEVLDDRVSSNRLGDFGFKTIIIDEVQHIKELTSDRYKAVSEVCKKSEHILGLSATPFKNNALEYFPILNILQPTMFPIKEQFFQQHCNFEYRGSFKKPTGLRNPERFRELTKHFIIHHTREEVLPDLPLERRNFEYCDIEDKDLQEAYDAGIEELDDFMKAAAGKKKDLSYYSNILEMLTKLRHITGLSKIETVVDKATEFLLSTNRKLVIYHHHIDVGDLIEAEINKYLTAGGMPKCLRLKGGADSTDMNRLVEEFASPTEPRIFIISTLAGGEGLDGLQGVCSDVIQVERQWNSVNEEQAERRFSRPGATADHIAIDYIIAIATIDDYLTEMVEKKRLWVKEGTTGVKGSMAENEVLADLADALVRVGKPKWRLAA
jgi:SNF2 family DNA or RNA helicase